jgi:hypothetical protein
VAGFDDDFPLTDEERALAERGAALLAAAMADPQARAPQSLRESLERARVPPPPATWLGFVRARVVAAAGAAVAATAAVLVLLVLTLGGGGDDGGPAAPTVAQVAAVSRLPATDPAPRPGGGIPPRLAAQVQGLPFPDWEQAFAWPATGQRRDSVGGRPVTTVFYRSPKGVTLGYAIVSGDALAGVPDGRDVVRGTATYRVARAAGRTTVTWIQQGHTCVIDAPSSVPDARLLELASWGAV